MPLSKQQRKNIALIAAKINQSKQGQLVKDRTVEQLQALVQAADQNLTISKIAFSLIDIIEILELIENGKDQNKFILLLTTVLDPNSFDIVIKNSIEKERSKENLANALEHESILSKLLRIKRRSLNSHVISEDIGSLINEIVAITETEFKKHVSGEKSVLPFYSKETTDEFYLLAGKLYQALTIFKLPPPIKDDCFMLLQKPEDIKKDDHLILQQKIEDLKKVGIYLFLNFIKETFTDYFVSTILPRFKDTPQLEVYVGNTLQQVSLFTLRGVAISQNWISISEEVIKQPFNPDENSTNMSLNWHAWHIIMGEKIRELKESIYRMVFDATTPEIFIAKKLSLAGTKLAKNSVATIESFVSELLNDAEKISSSDIQISSRTGFELKLLQSTQKSFYKKTLFPLHYAIEKNEPETVTTLILKMDINQSAGKLQRTPLMVAARLNRIEIAKILLTNQVSTNCLDADKLSALYLAVQENHLEMTALLLEHGANINQPCGEFNKTVLMLACEKGLIDIVRLLLLHDADITQKSTETFLKEDIIENSNVKIEKPRTANEYANVDIKRLLICFELFNKAISTNLSIDKTKAKEIKQYFQEAYWNDPQLTEALLDKHRKRFDSTYQMNLSITVFEEILQACKENKKLPSQNISSPATILKQLGPISENISACEKTQQLPMQTSETAQTNISSTEPADEIDMNHQSQNSFH